MKNIIIATIFTCFLLSCHESLQERAAREAKEYTERCCPTPVINYTRTDSVKFDIESSTYTYFCSFVDMFDDEKVISENRKFLHDGLKDNITSNVALKPYVDAGFRFAYVVHSDKNPKQILFNDTIVVK